MQSDAQCRCRVVTWTGEIRGDTKQSLLFVEVFYWACDTFGSTVAIRSRLMTSKLKTLFVSRAAVTEKVVDKIYLPKSTETSLNKADGGQLCVI
jgi:hypothetical protein